MTHRTPGAGPWMHDIAAKERIRTLPSIEPFSVNAPLFALAGWLVLALVMVLAWRRQLRTENAGIVDVIWAGSIGLLAIAYAVLGDGWLPRRVLVGLLAGGWSARLTWHLFVRVVGEEEDGRYQILRERLGDRHGRWMFFFFQAQALLAVLLSLVFLALCMAQDVGWRAFDFVAALLWITSIIGETIADKQLSAWRTNPENRGKTCRAGLWRYSRHPNYFFEWVHWLAYPVMGIGLAYGGLLWLAPLVLLFLVLKVTGIPPTEEQSVRSRGEDYRRYQRTTNAFFPGPPKPETEPRSLTHEDRPATR